MVKNLIYVLLLLIITSCKDSHKEIPEEKLRDMIADIILTDSYVSNVMKPSYRGRDTIDYFNPILDKYGYSIEDLEYTLDKYARRKTDIIWNTLDQATTRVDAIRSMYENNNKLRERLNLIIAERSTDTIYYNKDTIKIRNIENLQKLIKIKPINHRGTFTIKFNYKMGKDEENSSSYFVYYLSDTINKSSKPYRNSFWIASTNNSDEKRVSNRRIIVNDIRKYNSIKIIPFDYTNQNNTSTVKYKRMDTKIWDLLIIFTPDIRDVDKKVLLEDNPYPFIIDVQSLYRDTISNKLITPYSLQTLGIESKSNIVKDSL